MKNFPFKLEKPGRCLRYKLALLLHLDACKQCENDRCYWCPDPQTEYSFRYGK